MAYEGDDVKRDLKPGRIKPFKREDMEKYFSKVFPASFYASLLKLNMDSLYLRDKASSSGLTDGKTSYQMQAEYDRVFKVLRLKMSYISTIPAITENGDEIEEPSEYSVTYEFETLDNGQIRFRRIFIAA